MKGKPTGVTKFHSYTKHYSICSSIWVICAIMNFATILLFCDGVITSREIHVKMAFYLLNNLQVGQFYIHINDTLTINVRQTRGGATLPFPHLVQARLENVGECTERPCQTANLIQIRQVDFKNTSKEIPWTPHSVPCVAPCQPAWKKQIKADMLILIKMEKIKYEMILLTKMS